MSANAFNGSNGRTSSSAARDATVGPRARRAGGREDGFASERGGDAGDSRQNKGAKGRVGTRASGRVARDGTREGSSEARAARPPRAPTLESVLALGLAEAQEEAQVEQITEIHRLPCSCHSRTQNRP